MVHFLKLSPVFYDENHSGVILGPSLDDQPSDEAKKHAAAMIPASGAEAVHRGVTANHLHDTIVCLKTSSAVGDSHEGTVVVTIETSEMLQDPANVMSLDITLTQQSVLTIKCDSKRTRLVLMTPLLASIAKHEIDKCQALVADGKQCGLQKFNGQWCCFHLAQKVVLHDVELDSQKPWFQRIRNDVAYMKDVDDAIGFFNTIQESLALRTLITHILYAGDEDDNHAHFVEVTQQNRGNVLEQLAFKKSDGSGRTSIREQFSRFLLLAEDRSHYPQAREGWPRSELVVDFADAARIRANLGGNPASSPTVYHLLCPPDSTAMDKILWDKAGDLVDMPRLKKKEGYWESLPWEELDRIMREDGMIGAATEE